VSYAPAAPCPWRLAIRPSHTSYPRGSDPADTYEQPARILLSPPPRSEAERGPNAPENRTDRVFYFGHRDCLVIPDEGQAYRSSDVTEYSQ
jgi:hypothetical protein